MTVHELYEKLNGMIPSSLSCDWDNDGIMVESSPEKDVKKALVALDATMAAIDKAIEVGADVLITHHPMIFHPLKNLAYDSAETRKIIKCIEHNITVMSFHTRLDALDGGVNDALAEKLKLKDITPLCDMGRIGYTDQPASLDDFVRFVKNALGCDCIKYVGKAPVHKVALLGGDGKDSISDVLSAGCDTYVTGNTSYNIMADIADMELNCIEAGHFFTEDPVCDKLCAILSAFNIKSEKFTSNPIKTL